MKQIITIFLGVFTILVVSCKNEVQSKADSSAEKKPTELTQINRSKQQVQPLTKAQFSAFFPEYLGSHKRYNVHVSAPEAMATASYGDFKNTFNYSLVDGAKKKAVLKNFETAYHSDLKGPEGTEYIKKERDGFRTIAFLQPNIKRYTIEFIYKSRFRLFLEGSEHPDVLWSYIKKEK